jgi:hypothetical protein
MATRRMIKLGYNFITFDKVGQVSKGKWGGIRPGKGKGIGVVFTDYGVDRFSISTDMEILELLPIGRYVEIELTGFDDTGGGPHKRKLLDIQVDEMQGGLDHNLIKTPEPEPVGTEAEVPEEAPF